MKSVVSTTRSSPHSYFITGFVTRLTQRVPLVEQELITLLEHLSSPPIFNGIHFTRSLVLCVCFVERCLSFFFWPLCCLFSFDLRVLITPLVSSNTQSISTLITYIYHQIEPTFVVYVLVQVSNVTAISCREPVTFQGDDDDIRFVLKQNEFLYW